MTIQIFDAEITPRKGGGSGGGKSRVYPFDAMKVGQAFDVPDDLGVYRNGSRRQNILSSCARLYARKHAPDARFATRKHEGFIRVHRVA